MSADMTYDNLTLEIGDDGVAVCTFNRPEVRNALDQGMVDDIRSVLNRLAYNAEVSVLIFTGAGGKSFISGADIGQLLERRRDDAFLRINNSLFTEIERFPIPTIAAVRGWALGGGCELAMACDLRIAGQGAKFGQPEVALGIIPGAGGCHRLPKLVGVGMARELIFTGRIIDAERALEIGLCNRVVADEDVMSTARELAAEISKNSTLAVRMAKVMINASGEMSGDVALALEATTQAVLFEDDDKRARMTAFLERKRSPKK